MEHTISTRLAQDFLLVCLLVQLYLVCNLQACIWTGLVGRKGWHWSIVPRKAQAAGTVMTDEVFRVVPAVVVGRRRKFYRLCTWWCCHYVRTAGPISGKWLIRHFLLIAASSCTNKYQVAHKPITRHQRQSQLFYVHCIWVQVKGQINNSQGFLSIQTLLAGYLVVVYFVQFNYQAY